MSAIKFEKVLSFSSEDVASPAANLTAGECKWISADRDESREFVRIKLQEMSEIRQIEIENEASAFIEVQAGCEDDAEDDYLVILPAKSFMTPSESKNKLHTNRLKIFIDDLDERYADRKFNVIKIICTQPFNSSMQFGVRSIRLFREATIDENKKDAAKLNTGVFELKKDLPVSSLAGITLGSYIPKRTDDQKTDSVTVGAAFQTWRKTEMTQKTDEQPQKDKEKNEVETECPVFQKWQRKQASVETEKKEEAQTQSSRPLSKKDSTDGDGEPKPEVKRFNNNGNGRSQILKGVVFALSGYVNPVRSEIRDKGLRMGAKYRPDWTDECTHLICAFANTPKAAQVRKEGGKVVGPEWFDECKNEDKMVDCSKFVIEEESDYSSSDSEAPRRAAKKAKTKLKQVKTDYDDSYDESEAENSDDRDFIVNTSDEEDVVSSSMSSASASSESEFNSDDSDKVVSKKRKQKKHGKKAKSKKMKKTQKKQKSSEDSGSDSEAESTKKTTKKSAKKTTKSVVDKENKKVPSKFAKKTEINYHSDGSDEESNKQKNSKVLQSKQSNSSDKTEVNSDLDELNSKSSKESWELPDFFEGKRFYVYGDYDKKTRNNIGRMIIGFGGDLEDYMADNIDFVITDKSWNDEFKKSKKEHKNLKIVNEDWITACARSKKMIAYQTFEVDSD